MEPIFINRFKHTKEMYIEVNNKYAVLNPRISALVFLLAYSALAFIIYYYLYDLLAAIIVEALGIFFALYTPLRIHILAGKREKMFLELYEEIPVGETLFFDDHIFSVSETNKSELNLDYKKIRKVKQSKNFYLLILNRKLIVFVDKNNFEKGTCEEFEKFIKEKAVNAKIRL